MSPVHVDLSDRVNDETAIYGLIGDPVSRSLSPVIHNAGFRIRRINAAYFLIPLIPAEFDKGIRKIKTLSGIRGLNITIPYKRRIIGHLDRIDPVAIKTGAVNTVRIRNGKWTGYNTDVTGFCKWINPFRNHVNKKNILIAGAGGASAAALYALTHFFAPGKIIITNRTSLHAMSLVKMYELHADIRYKPFNKIHSPDYDTLINCIAGVTNYPAAMTRVIEPLHAIFDLNYQLDNALRKIARKNRAFYNDGLNMLIYQAQAAFKIWTQQHLPVKEIRSILDAELIGSRKA